MCGIAGVVVSAGRPPPDPGILLKMISQLQHRGPDDVGIYRDRYAGLACARLSIVDPLSGDQPIPNEDETVWVVCNGEIFNFEQLRKHLLAKRHRFRTHSDTEVVVHLYEMYGTEMFRHLNGDFAIAVWDLPRRRLLLARDRFGVRPLFFATADQAFVFGSEVKSLIPYPSLHISLDLQGLNHFFTFWSPIGQRTLFSGVSQLEAGHYLTLEDDGQPAITRYWRVPVPSRIDGAADTSEFIHRLRKSVEVRLSKDLPNGIYLSGGLDSAALTYLAQESRLEQIKTFSIAFDDRSVDESPFQRDIAQSLGTDHHELRCTPAAIGDAFPDVVWHAEAPLTRMAPVPMYLLSGAVRESGVKIALTGEGADEFLLGYDWYRAALLNEFVSNATNLPHERHLLSYILSAAPRALKGLDNADVLEWWPTLRALHRRPDTSFGVHRFRWDKMAEFKNYLSREVRSTIDWSDALDDLRALLPADFRALDVLHRAQYLDAHTLLTGYLLSTQGDRMSMAHAVESRVPFLDHTLVEFLAQIPADKKIVDFQEKWPLRKALLDVLPRCIVMRSKHSYTAPALTAFFAGAEQEYVMNLMGEKQIADAGIFDVVKVSELMQKCRANTFHDNNYVSAFVSILSTQMLSHLFFGSPHHVSAEVQNFQLYDRL